MSRLYDSPFTSQPSYPYSRIIPVPGSTSDGHDPTSTEFEVVDLGRNSRIGRELEGIKL
jgi:hypothetical protein